MRIGYISSDSGSYVLGSTGASVHITETCKALARLGHEVFVICANKGKECSQTVPFEIYEVQVKDPLVYRGIAKSIHLLLSSFANKEVTKLVYRDLDQRLSRFFYDRAFCLAAQSTLLQRSPDFLYERYGWYSTVGISFIRRNRLPLILEMNASLTFEGDAYEKRSPLLAILARQAERHAAQKADAIIVVSEITKNYLEKLGIPGQKIWVLPNGVNPEEFEGQECVGWEIRRRYHFGNRIVVGLLGNLRPWHGGDVLLRSAKLVMEEEPRLHFLIVGDGPSRAELAHFVSANGLEESVTFTGNVPHDEVPGYLSAMDIAVAPCPVKQSFWGSPTKIFEYMAAAKPVIVSRTGQLGQVIQHGQNGVLVEPGNVQQLAAAIIMLARDPNMRDRLGAEARRIARADYTWESNARKITSIYEGLAASKRKGRPEGYEFAGTI